MSYQSVKSHGNSNPTSSSQFLPDQSNWMSHWTRSPYQPRPLIKGCSSSFSEGEDSDGSKVKSSFQSRFKIPKNVYQSTKRVRTDDEERTLEMTSESLRSGGESLTNGKVDVPGFPQGRENSLSSSTIQQGPTIKQKTGSSSPILAVRSEDHSQQQCNPRHANGRICGKQVVPSWSLKRKGLAASHSYGVDNTIKSTSHAMPVVGFVPQAAYKSGSSLDQEDSNTILLHEKKTDNRRNIDSLFKQNNGALWQQDQDHHASSNNNFLIFTKGKCQSNQNHQKTRFFPGHICSRGAADRQEFDHGCHRARRMPCSVNNMATMRIYTAVDSVEDSPIFVGPSKFSQTTTHHVLITEKTNLNAAEREQILGAQHDLEVFPIPHHRQGVKIQSASEEKENVGDSEKSAQDRKNESSADTDSMDMDAFCDKSVDSHSGLAFPQTHETALENQHKRVDLRREKYLGKRPMTEMIHKNDEHQVHGAASSISSKTQIMDAEHLLPPASASETNPNQDASAPASETNPNQDASTPASETNPYQDAYAEQSCRWVKRLKLSPSSSFGLEKGESSSQDRVSVLLNQMRRRRQSPKKYMGLIPMDATGQDSLRNAEPSSVGLIKDYQHRKESQSIMISRPQYIIQNQRSLLSESWIRRWRAKQIPSVPERKDISGTEPVVICEPEISKFSAMDELKMKKFPSIAAMALMGKAMNGYQTCEISKRGPLAVWNTKEE